MGSEAYSTKSEFDRQVARMLANWASSVSDRGVAAEKKAELRKTYEKVGPGRFFAGVEAALHGHKTGFFPAIDEFEDFIPTWAGEKNVETCAMCANTGWPGMIRGECQHPPSCLHCEGATRYTGWKKCTHGFRSEERGEEERDGKR